MTKKYDVFGLGNTLMDVLIPVDDKHLIEIGLKKGVMHILEDKTVQNLLDKFSHKNPRIVPAGATTNTLFGIGALGGKCLLCGSVGNGKYGNMYEELVTKEGVTPRLMKCDKDRTGQVLCFVTPDAERTFGVHLGAAIKLSRDAILEEDIISSKYVYFTGYEFESVNKAVMQSIAIAKKNNVKIVIDLADPEIIKRNMGSIKRVVKDHIDILFMNKAEAKAFTGMDPEEAVKEVGKNVDIAVVKTGKTGSLVMSKGRLARIRAYNTNAVDTTGAGDLYAAGFLFSIIQGKNIEEAGKIGSFIGSKIVAQIGALMDEKTKKEIRAMFNNIR